MVTTIEEKSIAHKNTNTHLVLSELANYGFMQQEADVLHQVEGPWGGGALVHFLLVFGLMGIDALQDTQAPADDNNHEARRSQWNESMVESKKVLD